MKKLIIGRLSVGILMLTIVSAISVGFSPSSFVFTTKEGEQVCKVVNLRTSGDSIAVTDQWAGDSVMAWRVSNFKTEAKELNILQQYNPIQANDGKIEVCYTFQEPGNYRGVILLTPQQTNTNGGLQQIVRVGVW